MKVKTSPTPEINNHRWAELMRLRRFPTHQEIQIVADLLNMDPGGLYLRWLIFWSMRDGAEMGKSVTPVREPESVRLEMAQTCFRYACPMYIRRQALGWSLDTLAEKSGEDKALLSRIETRSRNPTIRALGKIAGALSVPCGVFAEEMTHWCSISISEDNAADILLMSFDAYCVCVEKLQQEWEQPIRQREWIANA